MRELDKLVTRLSAANRRSPFASMAKRRIETLRHTLEDMGNGVLDLYGSREELVTALTEFVSGLRANDMYLTISIPQFWWRENLGRDGRFLSMNQLAAVRGATIRRVFLISANDKQHAEYPLIIKPQLRVIEDLRQLGKSVEDPAIKNGGYYVGYISVTSDQQTREIQSGHQAGLLYEGGEGLLIAAMYRDDGHIGYLQFRTASGLVQGTRLYVEKLIEESKPLTEDVMR